MFLSRAQYVHFTRPKRLREALARVVVQAYFLGVHSAGVIGLTAGSLDDSSLFNPDMHFWVSSKQPWLEIADDLPQYLEGPPSKGY